MSLFYVFYPDFTENRNLASLYIPEILLAADTTWANRAGSAVCRFTSTSELMTWQDAESHCQLYGAHLQTLRDETEYLEFKYVLLTVKCVYQVLTNLI